MVRFGLLSVVVVMSACEGPVAVVDAGSAVVDAGSVVFVDAGSVDAGSADAVVDGGSADDGSAVVDAGSAAANDVKADAVTPPVLPKRPNSIEIPKSLSVFNRIIVKAKDRKATPATVKSAVEAQTKMSVSSVRVTARGFYLVEMAPTQPKRTKDSQARLVDLVRKSPAFSSVEADRLLQLR